MASTLLLCACASTTTPHYDLQYGDAVRQARARQTLHPNAGATATTDPGLDAKAAEQALIQYRDSFKAPPPVINVINIGGSAAGSGR